MKRLFTKWIGVVAALLLCVGAVNCLTSCDTGPKPEITNPRQDGLKFKKQFDACKNVKELEEVYSEFCRYKGAYRDAIDEGKMTMKDLELFVETAEMNDAVYENRKEMMRYGYGRYGNN